MICPQSYCSTKILFVSKANTLICIVRDFEPASWRKNSALKKPFSSFVVSLLYQVRTYFQNKWCRALRARGGLNLNRTLRLRGEANGCASSAPFGRGSKNQKFSLPFFFSSAGGVGGGRQKMERKFLVLLRRFRLQNEHLYYITCGSLALFISPSLRRDEALLLSVLW